jgi:hypothetical protein
MILIGTSLYLIVASLFVASLALAAARPTPTPNDCKGKRSNRDQIHFLKQMVIKSPTALG